MTMTKRHSKLKAVGLTGGIGSGKSSVARFYKQQFGIEYIDADVVCRDLLIPGASGWDAFVATFGTAFLNSDQSINRQLLRTSIFNDYDLRKQLDNIMHPLAKQEINAMLSQLNPRRCLVEVPLLFEAGWEDDFDAVIVVYASEQSCLERLMHRDNLSREAAVKAIAAQMPLSEKTRRADHVIDNSGTWEDTCRQMIQLGKVLWDDTSQ